MKRIISIVFFCLVCFSSFSQIILEQVELVDLKKEQKKLLRGFKKRECYQKDYKILNVFHVDIPFCFSGDSVKQVFTSEEMLDCIELTYFGTKDFSLKLYLYSDDLESFATASSVGIYCQNSDRINSLIKYNIINVPDFIFIIHGSNFLPGINPIPMSSIFFAVKNKKIKIIHILYNGDVKVTPIEDYEFNFEW